MTMEQFLVAYFIAATFSSFQFLFHHELVGTFSGLSALDQAHLPKLFKKNFYSNLGHIGRSLMIDKDKLST